MTSMGPVLAAPTFGAQFYQLIIEDDSTLIENVHVVRLVDRGNPGYIIFLPSYRCTLYLCANERVRSTLAHAPREEKLIVMREIMSNYNDHTPNVATVLAFCIYLLEYTGEMSSLPGVINVRNIRLGMA